MLFNLCGSLGASFGDGNRCCRLRPAWVCSAEGIKDPDPPRVKRPAPLFPTLLAVILGVALAVPGTAPASTPASVSVQPQDLTVAATYSATFQVSAAGMAPLFYQWQRNGVNIAGATNAAYSILSTSPSDAGSFGVMVSNDLGSVTSSNALRSEEHTSELQSLRHLVCRL